MQKELVCVECKDEYDWLGDNMVTLPDGEYICLYCYYDADKGTDMATETVLWEGERPCSKCTGKVHSKWEPSAKAWVCAGCYNEFAYVLGWERYPSQDEKVKHFCMVCEAELEEGKACTANHRSALDLIAEALKD